MPDIWWKAHPHDLHRLSDRVSSVYVERSHLDRDENAVVIINKRETVRVPAAMVAVMLLGPGTRVTHGAINLLADSGTAVCWVGQQGVRMYAAGLGPSRGAGLLHCQAWLVTRTKERLGVARAMYAMRFPGEDAFAVRSKAGVFVGNPSRRIRDRIWALLTDRIRDGQAILVEPADNEQGWAVRTAGKDRWRPVDYDGLILSARLRR